MSVGSILADIGKGAMTGAKAIGDVAAPILQRTAQVVSGEAPQIDEEQRQQQMKLDDAALNAKADELETQLQMGRKYGTLTPEQQQQYVDQITGLFSHPKHMNTLMTRLQRAIHPQGTTYQPSEPLANATPKGGTAAADVALLDEKQGLRPVPGVHPFQNKEDGQWYQPMYNRMGQVTNQLVEGYTPPAQKAAGGKSPPLTGDKLPADAVGADGQPIAPEDRNAGKSFVEYHGSWWPVAKPKPVFKTVKGHSVLVDSQSGAVLRDLGPAGTAKVTSRQTLQPGDDGQMHLVTLTSVTTPEGATIEVNPETEGGAENQSTASGGTSSSSTASPKTGAKKVGHVLPKTGAKSNGSTPIVPGLSDLAHSKMPVFKSDVSAYTKLNEEANQKEASAMNAEGLLSDPNRQTDLELVFAWVRANVQGAGRMTNTEINQASQAGSLGTRAKNAISLASTGRLAPELEQQFLSDIKRAAATARQQANDAKSKLAQPSGGNGTSSGSQGKPPNAVGTVTYQGKKYWVDKDRNNLGEAR